MAIRNRRRRVTPRSRTTSLNASTRSNTLSYSSPGSITANASIEGGQEEIYHPIPGDDTHRIGAGGLLFLAALATATTPLPGMPGLPDLGPGVDSYSTEDGPRTKLRPPPQGEKTAFGLLRGHRTVSQLLDEHNISHAAYPNNQPLTPSGGGGGGGGGSGSKWTKLDPCRFSVEFWGVERLAEKERTYSTTHLYAGSLFNVYVQTIRKKDKGTQLGIYLHRQNPTEPFPTPSRPKMVGRGVTSATDEASVASVANAARGANGVSGSNMVGPSDTRGRNGMQGHLSPTLPSSPISPSSPTSPISPRMFRAMSTPAVTVGSPPERTPNQSSTLASGQNVDRDTERTRVGTISVSSPRGEKEEISAPYWDERRVTRVS